MKWTPIIDGVYLNDKRKWSKLCPICEIEQSYGKRTDAVQAKISNQPCRSCSNKTVSKRVKLFYKEIRHSWFLRSKRLAERRNIIWEINYEYIWKLYISQNRKCALSGREIGWEKSGLTHSISIDRIDSGIGYIEGNIQLVHKDLNTMKHVFSQKRFIELCEMVVRYQKSLKLGL